MNERMVVVSTWITVCLLFTLSVVTVQACPDELPTMTVLVNGQPLLVEVASTPSARKCGLSHRKSLQNNRGMLFVSPVLKYLRFWMKDTEIPLSIAFIDPDGIICEILKMAPMQVKERYIAPCPGRYAIEVNKGWFEKHGIEAGHAVELEIPKALKVY